MTDQAILPALSLGWCILRTSGGRTLPLARSLAAAGFDVWSPIHTQTRRLQRSKVRVEREAPIMPTFVFARAEDLADLYEILCMPMHEHPPFSIFRHLGRIPIIHDREVANLRSVEERAKLKVMKKQRHVFPIGERVHVPEGGFAGMSGIVEDGDGKFALVCFNDRMRVRVATFLLRADLVDDASATDHAFSGNAAQAA